MKFRNYDEIINRFNLFIKFGEKEHLKSLQNGKLYMRNLKYYNDLEKDTGIFGIGDVNDGKFILNNIHFHIHEKDTDKYIGEFVSPKISLEQDDFKYAPVFCLYTMDKRNLFKEGVKKDDEGIYEFHLGFNSSDKENISKNFKDYALLILNNDIFLEKIKKAFLNNNIEIVGNKVSYTDLNINDADYVKDISNSNTRIPFWKDKNKFDYQQEYRILGLNKRIEDSIELDIGSIKDVTVLVKTKDILDYICIFETEYEELKEL